MQHYGAIFAAYSDQHSLFLSSAYLPAQPALLNGLRIEAGQNRMSVMRRCLHFIVRGIVQGVGFRYHASKKAHVLGLVGWVRNKANGDVELIACGSECQLDDFHAWLQHGPAPARVDSVMVSAVSLDPIPGEFAIL